MLLWESLLGKCQPQAHNLLPARESDLASIPDHIPWYSLEFGCPTFVYGRQAGRHAAHAGEGEGRGYNLRITGSCFTWTLGSGSKISQSKVLKESQEKGFMWMYRRTSFNNMIKICMPMLYPAQLWRSVSQPASWQSDVPACLAACCLCHMTLTFSHLSCGSATELATATSREQKH